ncbi:MAG: hypothetical protein IVW54_06590 [Candidatus Binataceae bacterium]|nr:hypothetical protein [Candidatus Binataceae bacterium]
MADNSMEFSKLRVRLSEMPPRYRDATALLAGMSALIAGMIADGLLRGVLGFYASTALSGCAFLTAGYIAALLFRYVVSRSSTSSAAQIPLLADEGKETDSDFIDETLVMIRRGIFGIVSLFCLIAAASNVRIFIENFDPITLAAIAGTASWSISSLVASISLNLVHRRKLTLGLIVGNLICLMLALASFTTKPSFMAIVVIVWCAAIVILPLLKLNIWWNEA